MKRSLRIAYSFELYLILLLTVNNVQVEGLQLNKTSNALRSTETSQAAEYYKQNGHPVEKLKQNKNQVWMVFDHDQNYPCILLQGSLEFKVPYLLQTDMKTIRVPQEAVAEGSCSTLWGDYQEIKLTWDSFISNSSNITVLNSVYLGFAAGWESEFSDLSIPVDQYALNTIRYHCSSLNDSSHNTLMSYSASDFIAFVTPRYKSYSCSSANKLSIGELELTTSNLRLQAFSPQSRSGEFLDDVECSLDQSNDVWNGIFEFIKWFSVASTIVVALVAILYILLRYIQKRLDWIAGI